MDISTLKAGDEVCVFDRSKGKYIKRVVEIGNVGCPYFYDDPRGYFRTRATVPLDDTSDAVTAEELPAAKKRHAARRKAEKEAEEARKKRVLDAEAAAGELRALGVSIAPSGINGLPTVNRSGSIRADLTLEQARALLAALRGA